MRAKPQTPFTAISAAPTTALARQSGAARTPDAGTGVRRKRAKSALQLTNTT
jgi:hypothetical protein